MCLGTPFALPLPLHSAAECRLHSMKVLSSSGLDPGPGIAPPSLLLLVSQISQSTDRWSSYPPPKNTWLKFLYSDKAAEFIHVNYSAWWMISWWMLAARHGGCQPRVSVCEPTWRFFNRPRMPSRLPRTPGGKVIPRSPGAHGCDAKELLETSMAKEWTPSCQPSLALIGSRWSAIWSCEVTGSLWLWFKHAGFPELQFCPSFPTLPT